MVATSIIPDPDRNLVLAERGMMYNPKHLAYAPYQTDGGPGRIC